MSKAPIRMKLESPARMFDSAPLRGTIDVPGDKSISHRALMAAAFSERPIAVSNLNPGRDVRATLEALIALGASIESTGPELSLRGGRLREPVGVLDCMNSGSTARMMLGVCAGAGVRASFDGDESLRKRPMEPVAAQLRAFGALIETNDGRMPVRLLGRPRIETQRFILLSASAQVKSALLFAALYAKTPIEILGDKHSRDHTERLFRYLGADIEWNGTTIALRSGLTRNEPIDVAGDMSAASFFITAATISPGSNLTIRHVGVNPTRTGLVDALRDMGADIEYTNPREVAGEPLADIVVRHATLRAASIGPDVALRGIDEVMLIAVAAAFASGRTKITGVRELRTKESDRVAAIERLLGSVGIAVETEHNGLTIEGGRPTGNGSIVETHHDHRTAMAAATLAAGAGPVGIDSDESIDVSFPSFLETLGSVTHS
jgi:3-phosphoshikimate 1-carboxyvinyltransferase